MKNNFENLKIETQNGVTTIFLNRPELHNAFNEVMIAELLECFQALATDVQTRVVLMTGLGKSFCAGADLNWMKRVASYSSTDNMNDAKQLHQMLLAICRCPKPVIAKVNGAALGGGVGLVAAVDMAFAVESAFFGFSEVKLGLIPAVISPFAIRKIGEAKAREFFLTGERFKVPEAFQMGLINGYGSLAEVNQIIQKKIDHLLQNGPESLSAAKSLIEEVSGYKSLDTVGDLTSRLIAEQRASDEGQEGMKAFLEKRAPAWK